MKIYIIYMIGLVFFTVLPYLVVPMEERPRHYQAIFLTWGLLWPFFLVWWIFEIWVQKWKRSRRAR